MTWASVAASAKGSSHDAETPNQDAFQVIKVALPAGGVALVAAVADGHGGRRYVRSDTGSAFAVQLAVDTVAENLSAGSRQPLSHLLQMLAPKVVALWRDAVMRHVDDHPFTAGEAARAGVGLAGQPLVAYGSTLLLAVLQGTEIAIAQIGDGDVLIRTATGALLLPVPTDERLVASETTSLCLPGAEADFRYAFLASDVDAELMLLATDGYGNSFASDRWREEVGADFAQLAGGDAGWANVEAKLPQWLAESAQVGGDDVTAVLLVNRAGEKTRAAAPRRLGPMPVVRFSLPPVEPPSAAVAGKSGRPIAVVVSGFALAAAVIWAVVALTAGSKQPTRVPGNPVQLPAGATASSLAFMGELGAPRAIPDARVTSLS